MQKALGGSGRGAVVTGMVLATLALAGCESAEDQEIRALIDEIAAVQEQTIAAMEASAAAKAEEALERARGEERWPAEVLASFRADVTRNEERDAARRAERLESRRRAHENLLTKLRETLASGDWAAAYPVETELNIPPLEIVRFVRSRRQTDLGVAEADRDWDVAWRERAAERREAAAGSSEAMKRVPDPSTWMPRQEPPSIDEMLGKLEDYGAERETGR